MNEPTVSRLLAEPLIAPRQAAYCLNLPLHWLNQPSQRERRRVPHYRVGKLVRFKLSELLAWSESLHAAAVEALNATEDADA